MTQLRPVLRRLGEPGGSGGGGIDADAAAWGNAVVAAGSSYSVATLEAVSAFCKKAKAAGYWTKLNRINLFAGTNLTAALVPLKVGGGSATDTNVNFVAGDYTLATGLTGNGTTKYLNTGLVPSTTLTLNDIHLAVYNRAAGAAGGGIHLSASDGVSFLELLAPNTDGSAYSRICDVTSQAAGAVSANYGLIVGSRVSATSNVVYKNATAVNSSATSAGSRPAFALFVFARNGSGTPSNYVSHALGGYSIGSGLTAAEVSAYATHMEAFQDAIGRGVM